MGVLTQLAALGLILLMLGAIQKKIFVWHTGFWGAKSDGWHYDLMMILMNLVIAFTDGGSYVLTNEVEAKRLPYLRRPLLSRARH